MQTLKKYRKNTSQNSDIWKIHVPKCELLQNFYSFLLILFFVIWMAIDKQQSEMAAYRSAHHCWHEANIRVHICVTAKVISKYNHTGTVDRECFSPHCRKRTFQLLHSLKNFPSYHLLNTDQKNALPVLPLVSQTKL